MLTDVTGYKGLLSGEQIDIHGTQLKSEEDKWFLNDEANVYDFE